MKRIKYQINFVREFLKKERHISLLDETYNNSHTPIKCQCDICFHKWSNCFANLKFGQGCPRCGKLRANDKHRKKPEQLTSLFLQKNILPLNIEDYKTAKTPILCKCRKCEWEWTANYSRIILEQKGCPNCKKLKLRNIKVLSQDQVQKQLDKQNILLNDVYINSTTPIKCKCKNCNFEWTYCSLNNLINNQTFCPNCRSISFLSEKVCRIVMENIFGDKFQKCFISVCGVGGGRLELDGYNEKLKIAFEHNGPQHYSPKWFGKSNENFTRKFRIQCKNDKIKSKWCKTNNISLIVFRDLGRYTTEKNILQILKTQLVNQGYTPPSKINTYIPDFRSIKQKIIEQCQ